ncbi:MAG: hypothetical protein CL840_13335 [Crocinitomicaceae bacterium]|nr:hypothetical protein [Crocinitomicaceae bacterium]|tara:strand:+ start:1252 stop:2112 length:861 start_codon:yes stop_codon:yes gene_type:complete
MRKFSSLISLTLLLVVNHVFASNNNYPVGARAAALGNASVTFTSVYSGFHNQAGLAYLENIEFGFSYRNNFLLKQTGLKSGVLAIPIKKIGVVGLSVNSFGYNSYGEHKFGLAFAKQFGDVFSFGLQLDYLQTQFNDPYGSKGVVLGEFGVMGKLTKELTIAAHIFNPTRTYMDKETSDRVPTIIKAGLGYEFSEKLLTSIELEKDLDLPKPNFKAGIEYKPYKAIALRVGANSYPVKASFGVGVYLNKLALDVASEYHQTLGFIPQFSLRYSIIRKKNNADDTAN